MVPGNVAYPEVANREYRVKALDNIDLPLSATTDCEGRVRQFVGTDSGFEQAPLASHLLHAELSVASTTGGYMPPVWTLALIAAFGAAVAVLGLVVLRLRPRW